MTEPKENFIILNDTTIEPVELSIKSGDSTNWVNYSDEIHTIIFKTGDFESGDLKRGESFRLVFDGKGEYDYYCEDNEAMIGKIIVS